jgi:hypothetical protein
LKPLLLLEKLLVNFGARRLEIGRSRTAGIPRIVTHLKRKRAALEAPPFVVFELAEEA